MVEPFRLHLQLCHWLLILVPRVFINWLYLLWQGRFCSFFLGTSKCTSGESFQNPFLKVAAALGACVYIMDATYRQIWVKAIWSKQSVLRALLPAELCPPDASKCPAEGSDVERGRFRCHYSTHCPPSGQGIPYVWRKNFFSFWGSSKRDHLSCCVSSLWGWKLLSLWPTQLKPGSSVGSRK